MYFYEIGINDRGLKKHQVLTYHFDTELSVGDSVEVKLRNKARNGVVVRSVKKPDFQTKPIERLLQADFVPPHLLDFAQLLSKHYAVDLGVTINMLLPRGAQRKRRADTIAPPVTQPKKANNQKLSKDQQTAVDAILKQTGTFMLRGVTGSGKTRVYMEVAKTMREQALGVIILVPEIGLTSQMQADLQSMFNEEVFIVHSNQTEAERHILWTEISKAKQPIVIGPRSALFAPVKRLGLIVIDEEHESSYKQDISPKYHAVRAASLLRQTVDCRLVLGSATPSIEDMYHAQQTKTEILDMPTPVKKPETTTVEIVDMKDRDVFTKNKWISDPLISHIQRMLHDEKQVLLFQNRRGNATHVVCESCGWVDECPNCVLPLTHHADWQINVCHTCNYRHPVMTSCPECKKPELVYKGLGTKELYIQATKLFPGARIERFDSDVKDKSEKLEQRYGDIVEGKVDIIIGTQMIAKGLDIPNLGLVGITNADMTLGLPDYSSSERTFQLITQVIGRVGRHQKGEVVLQSYNPQTPAITLAAKQNYDAFYENELADRKAAGYPPFVFMMQLIVEKKTNETAKQAATRLANSLKKQVSQITVLGPAPAFHYKTRQGWRWQIVIKSQNRKKLVNIAGQLPAGWQFELDPINLL